MAESIVSDWLAEYTSLEPTELQTFIAEHENNHEVSSALFTIINERLKYPDVLHSICDQLFSFYRSNEIKLKSFTLQFVPTLIYTYLNAVAQGDKKSCRNIETLLLGIYNIEVSTDDGQPKVVSFRMPVLAQPSIYHEEKQLNAYDLRRYEENINKDVNWGPLPQVESVNAQNRLKIMTAVMFVYNQQLSTIPKSSLYHLCRVATQLVTQGFGKYSHAHRASYGNDPSGIVSAKPVPRIPTSAQFLLELLHATYFAMFNEFASIAIQAVDDIHNRACYELYPEVILVTNAIKNSLLANATGQPSDGPMGISVALTPSTHTVTVSMTKSMITNASFRTKKLPDDIPIQAGDETGVGNVSQLISITEESETGGSVSTTETSLGMRNNLVRSSKEILKTHKVPFPGFKKKDKDKEKEKSQDASGGTGTAVAGNTNTTSILSGTKIQSKNGNIFSDSMKDSVIIAATKQLTKKDKRGSNAALQAASIDVSDATYLDKASPSLQIKRKSSSVDVTNGPLTSIDHVQLSTFANGNPIITEETRTSAVSANGDYVITETNNTDSDISTMISEHNNGKPATTSTANNNMQISQV